MKIAFTFQTLSHNARIFTKEVKNSSREWKMVWRWSHDAATWMRSDPSREVQLQVDLCSQVPSSLGGLLHHLEFADWCSKTLALPARIPISLGSHRILFSACKKPSALHTSWLHLALWHSLSQSCGYCALSELIIVTGLLKTDIPMRGTMATSTSCLEGGQDDLCKGGCQWQYNSCTMSSVLLALHVRAVE